MIGWEDILNEYLEGRLLRADVEALRWKIQLSPAARAEVERDLKLVDDLAATAASVVPGAQGLERLRGKLHAHASVVAPEQWHWTDAGPVSSTAAAETSDATDGELAALTNELQELGRSIAVPQGAPQRLIAMLRRAETPEFSDMQTEAVDEPMRLFPAESSLRIDALAASKDVEPVDEDFPGDAAKKPERTDDPESRGGPRGPAKD
jgi:hypothetical protein